MKHLPLMFAFLATVLLGSSCGSTSEAQRVWVEEGQLVTDAGPHFMYGVCYHPVPVGESERSFETLTQDLALMKSATLACRSLLAWGTTKAASTTCSPGRTSTT